MTLQAPYHGSAGERLGKLGGPRPLQQRSFSRRSNGGGCAGQWTLEPGSLRPVMVHQTMESWTSYQTSLCFTTIRVLIKELLGETHMEKSRTSEPAAQLSMLESAAVISTTEIQSEPGSTSGS